MTDYVEILGWDSTIEEDQSYSLLPEGDYDFKVIGFEKSVTKSEGIPMAVVTLEVGNEACTAVIKDYIVLKKTVEWKIGSYFLSVGMKKRGERMTIDFPGSVGRSGRCHVVVDEYIGGSGTPVKRNKVTKYLEPARQQAAAAPATRVEEIIPDGMKAPWLE